MVYPIRTTMSAQMRRLQFFVVGVCIISAFFFYFIQLETDLIERTNYIEYKAINNRNESIKDKSETQTDLKHILFWNRYDYAPFYFFEPGQKSFIKNKCKFTNCYVTTNRKYLKHDEISKFHAIAFNGRTMSAKYLPKKRSPHQKYIYVNMESGYNYPICDEKFDGFFNWTATYKLNSDILFPYIAIKNNEGQIIGPSTNMKWPKHFPDVNVNFTEKLKSKSKAAAWFVSNCKSGNFRERFFGKLKNALDRYGLAVDVYGPCGYLRCPKSKSDICNSMIERDYFFYLSFENSFSEDYVTEKLLLALQHNAVPIVYGGADYSKFLPPGSYINARQVDVNKLAATIETLMKNPGRYKEYFRWKSQYTYFEPSKTINVCNVCAALNEKFDTSTVYKEIRKWWNPNYENLCGRINALREVIKSALQGNG